MNMLLYYCVHVVEIMYCLSYFKRFTRPEASSLVLKVVCRRQALEPEHPKVLC